MPYDLQFQGDFFQIADFVAALDKGVTADRNARGLGGRPPDDGRRVLAHARPRERLPVAARQLRRHHVCHPDRGGAYRRRDFVRAGPGLGARARRDGRGSRPARRPRRRSPHHEAPGAQVRQAEREAAPRRRGRLPGPARPQAAAARRPARRRHRRGPDRALGLLRHAVVHGRTGRGDRPGRCSGGAGGGAGRESRPSRLSRASRRPQDPESLRPAVRDQRAREHEVESGSGSVETLTESGGSPVTDGASETGSVPPTGGGSTTTSSPDPPRVAAARTLRIPSRPRPSSTPSRSICNTASRETSRSGAT